MKNLKNTSKRWLAGICGMGLLSLFLSSCLKENNNSYYNPPVAYLSVTNTSPGEPPMNFFLNNNQVNAYPLTFGRDIDYFKAFTGTRTANFDNAATMGQILSDTVNLVQNQIYSLFLVNTSAHPQILLLTDSLTQPAAGKASIRFVNLGPDAGAVDLGVQGGGTWVTNKSFKGHSGFISVNGDTNVTFEVRKTGTSTVLATLPNIMLSSGGVYTIWLQGLTNTTVTGENLGVGIETNARY